MYTKMKKSLLLSCFIAFVFAVSGLALCMNTVLAYDASKWGVYRGEDSELWQVSADEISTKKLNTAFQGNFLLTDDVNAVGDYKVTAHFQMKDNPAEVPGGETEFGLVPWYIDDNNFIVAYVRWENGIASGLKMRNIQITGKSNGQTIKMYREGQFLPSEWNDIWIHDSGSDIAVAPDHAAGFKMTVVKKHADGNFGNLEGDFIMVYINNDMVWRGFHSTNAAADIRHQQAKVGLYSFKSVATVSDFAVSDHQENVYNFNPLSGTDYVATGMTASSWTNSEGAVSVNAVDSEAGIQSLALRKTFGINSNYDFSAKMKANEKSEQFNSGLVVWYKDMKNYINANLIYDNNVAKLQLSGKLNGADMSQVASDALSITSDTLVIRGVKMGNNLIIYGAGEEVLRYSNVAIASSYFVGLNAFAGDVTFSDISLSEVEYNSFDEYNLSAGGYEWKAGTASRFDFSFDDGIFSVDATEYEKYGYIYRNVDTYGKNESVIAFTNAVGAELSYGAMVYVENSLNYIGVAIVNKKVEVFSIKNGTSTIIQTYDLDAAFDITQDHTLSVATDLNKLSVKIDNIGVVENLAIEGVSGQSQMSGVLIKGGSVCFDRITMIGFRPYDPIVKDDMTYYGARPDSWIVDGTKMTGNSTVAGGFKSVNALKTIDFTSKYYVGAEIKVTEGVTSEHKVGLIPWYIDNNNFVYVWFSEWVEGPKEIIIHAYINGVAAGGNDWHVEGLSGFNFMQTVNTLEIKMEGNQVAVYVNKNQNAAIVKSFEGLAEASEGKTVKAGMNVFNVTAEFTSFGVSTEPIFKDEIAPEIELIGSKPTKGTVGSEITLPVIDVLDNLGEIINANVVVKHSDGTPINVQNNKFTPSKAGKYTVTITAEDSWGNKAETITWDIDVEEKIEETTNDKGCGSALSVGGASIMITIMILAACAVMISRRKANR